MAAAAGEVPDRAGRVGAVTRPGDFPTVGIVGAGQLARMCVGPAVELGVRLRVLAETADDPAAQVVPDTTVGDYRDLATLRAFAARLRRRHLRPRARADRAPAQALQADGPTSSGPDPTRSCTGRTSG